MALANDLEAYREVVGLVGLAIETVGVAVIVAGTMYSLWRFAARTQPCGARSYTYLRQDVGRSILLGLEFFIGGDIVRTVAVTLSLESVALLGLIVLIRTFLSMALHVEVEGCWPWQLRADADGRSARPGEG
ncbi:MAG: DUF1622 domain-containing protein [Gammaproteobacteria bacterium]